MSKELLERKDVSKEYTWDLESMFANIDEWEKEYKRIKELGDKFQDHRKRFTKTSKDLLQALRDRDDLYRGASHLYSYARMKLDEDSTNSKSQDLSDRGMSLLVSIREKTSFLIPELLNLDKERLEDYMEENEDLRLYKQMLDDIMRQKEHVLSAREESILAQVGEVGSSPQKIYSIMNSADLKFPTIKDEDGKDVELTQGNFIPLMESKDREVRKSAFKSFYSVFEGFKNTFAASLDGELRNNIFNARMRNYRSTREASLDKNNIPLSVYDNLIRSVHDNLDSMYKYMDIRKKVLGVDKLNMYDLYTPIVKDVDFNIKYDEGVDLIKEALLPLGEEYLHVVNEGFSSRWIDVYENRGKRSGAYSSGSYDSKPFILLNYHDTLDSVFTMAHEMGHSVHSYLTRKHQPFPYGNYSIFVAEVASTANEALLLDYMLENTRDKNEKLYLLNHYLESFRTTVFRQTMFAEFEMIINKHLEEGGSLTAEYLSNTYKELNKLYYGPNVVVNEEIAVEWARIPHFYMNFYVYQYATGFAAAIALSNKILAKEEDAVEKYMDFLKSGSSDYPINVLEKAGVDMRTKKPVDDAMKLFTELVDELDKLI